jgi:hypothetical protein
MPNTRHIRFRYAIAMLSLALAASSSVMHSPAGAVTVRRRVLNVNIALPSKIVSVDYMIIMQQRTKGGQWTDLSKVVPCYDPTRSECRESRIIDPGPNLPAVPGQRTKTGAYYRFVFEDLPAGSYRFVGNSYYLIDSVRQAAPFKSRSYRTT